MSLRVCLYSSPSVMCIDEMNRGIEINFASSDKYLDDEQLETYCKHRRLIDAFERKLKISSREILMDLNLHVRLCGKL